MTLRAGIVGLLTTTLLASPALAAPAVYTAQMDTMSAIAGNGSLLVGDDSDQLEIGGGAPFAQLGYADGNAAHPTTGLAASYDGSVLVGTYFDGSFNHAFRYSGGTFSLLSDMGPNAYAVAVTDDGQDIAGWSVKVGDSTDHALAWFGGGTSYTDLGTLAGPSRAYGISNNGTVVGYQNDGTHNFATSWTYDGSTVTPTTLALPGGHDESIANAISRDGSTIVGEVSSAGIFSDAVMWKGGVATLLNAAPGGSGAESALAVSQSGLIIVGTSNNEAFRWTQTAGMQNLNTLLTDAGVTPPATLISAYGISDDGTVMIAHSTNAFEDLVVVYDTVFDSGAPIAGVTTQSDVQAGTQRLADQQRDMLIDSRATANVLLGMLQPVSDSSYAYVGDMFGSNEGFFGGQYARNNVTLHGGVSYGYQDYSAIDQSSNITLALAARYTFEPISAGLRPYAEIGSWGTPHERLEFSRPYANGTGIAVGKGNTSAYNYAGYGQLGLTWQAQHNLQLATFVELGRQAFSYDGYSEAFSAANPFPAEVSGSTLRHDVARWGANLSRTIDSDIYPVTVTLAGALAHSFNVQSNLRATVGGIGATQAASDDAVWEEYGAQFSLALTQQISANVGVIATSGNAGLDTQMHGLAGLNFKF